jgi:hypothetical protein
MTAICNPHNLSINLLQQWRNDRSHFQRPVDTQDGRPSAPGPTRPLPATLAGYSFAGNWVAGIAFAGMWGAGYAIAGVVVAGHPLPMFQLPYILVNSYLCYIYLKYIYLYYRFWLKCPTTCIHSHSSPTSR